MCLKVCGPEAITRTEEDVEGGVKITYKFDLTSCTFCGMCQDFCSEKAIRLTEDYHMVELDKHDLVSTGYRIKEKVKGKLVCGDSCVFCGLCVRTCPAGAITVDRARKPGLWTNPSVYSAACVSANVRRNASASKSQLKKWLLWAKAAYTALCVLKNAQLAQSK